MIEKQPPSDFYRIEKLFGDLTAAGLKRICASGEDPFTAISKEVDDVSPKSAEEIAVWNELTSPGNHDALRQYVAFFSWNVHLHAKNLFNTLVEESDRRAAGTGKGVGNQ